jgi:hypothetical protein
MYSRHFAVLTNHHSRRTLTANDSDCIDYRGVDGQRATWMRAVSFRMSLGSAFELAPLGGLELLQPPKAAQHTHTVSAHRVGTPSTERTYQPRPPPVTTL